LQTNTLFSNNKPVFEEQSDQDHRKAIVDAAEGLLGAVSIKYVKNRPEIGQSPETGFDCSGFVRFVLDKAELYIPTILGWMVKSAPCGMQMNFGIITAYLLMTIELREAT
jgi:hypothetical protein